MQKNKLLLSFFFVSLYSIALETFLTRYFAITSWAEYGYWIISIVMAGFAVSGVVMSLFEKFFERHAERFLFVLPALLVLASAAGIWGVSVNQFNPLEFQHEAMWTSQIANIFKYYAALFPIFFLLGTYIGLVYVRLCSEISRIYAINLVGSALGSILILGLMYLIGVFTLPAVFTVLMIVPVFLSLNFKNTRTIAVSAALVLALGASELFFAKYLKSDFPFYKPIYSAMNMEGNRVLEKMSLPEGYYWIIDNPTEYNNTDLSNNYDLLKMGPPPRSHGLYRDGRRAAPLLSALPGDYSYLNGALDAYPYRMLKSPSVLLAGTNGGYRVLERRELGASSITALESDALIHELVDRNLFRAFPDAVKGVNYVKANPYTYCAGHDDRYDIIELSSDFIYTGDSNKYAFTVDAVKEYLDSLNAGGVLSLPVSITEFTVHSVKLLETVNQALKSRGVKEPGTHVLVYRSNWTARVLVGERAFSPEHIAALKKFCDERSFDISYYHGIDPNKVMIWNDLPAISFDEETSDITGAPSDAIMKDAVKVFSPEGKQFLAGHFFNLSPSTVDRPSFFSVLRFSRIKQIIAKRSILPQEEIGFLINIAVLSQAVLLALVILLLPLIRIRSVGADKRKIPGMMAYFASLGLGFLFIEIALIERFTLFLGSATASFAIVLAGMLIFSGAGSYFSSRFSGNLVKGVKFAVAGIAVMCVLYILLLFPVIMLGVNLPFVVKGLLIVLLIAPVSFFLGMPFPLGLSSVRGHAGTMVPWGWAINGAFSVIAGPLASMVSLSAGYASLFAISIVLYVIVLFAFPGRK